MKIKDRLHDKILNIFVYIYDFIALIIAIILIIFYGGDEDDY